MFLNDYELYEHISIPKSALCNIKNMLLFYHLIWDIVFLLVDLLYKLNLLMVDG